MRRWLLALLTVGILAALGWYAWRWYTTPNPPDLDLEGVDASVAEALRMARERVLCEPRSGPAWGRFGMVLAAHQFKAAALECFIQAETLDPREPRWPYHRSVLLAEEGQQEALPCLRRAVDLCNTDMTAPRLRLAEALLAAGNRNEAQEHFQRVLGHDPFNPRAHLGLARLAFAAGDLKDSQAHLRAAAKSPFTRKAAGILQMQLRFRQRHRAAAGRDLADTVRLPDDPRWPDPFVEEVNRLTVGESARYQLACNLYRQQLAKEAVATLQETLQDYPGSARCWRLLGCFLRDGQDLRGAEQAFRASLRVSPEQADTWVYLGNVRLRQGHPGDAEVCFRKAIAQKPRYSFAYYNLGLCLRERGQCAAALKACRQALRSMPNYVDAHILAAELLAGQGKFGRAAEHLRQALAVAPDHPMARKLFKDVQRRD
jgi:tetratricopeptide (TPR) repeat protein